VDREWISDGLCEISSLSMAICLLSCIKRDNPDWGEDDVGGKLELCEAERVKRVKGGGENGVLDDWWVALFVLPPLMGGETYLVDKEVGKASVWIVCLRPVVIGDRPSSSKKKVSFNIIWPYQYFGWLKKWGYLSYSHKLHVTLLALWLQKYLVQNVDVVL
jgi:hypothetical protein